MRQDTRYGESLSGQQGHPHHYRHDCGRHDRRGAFIDQEQQEGARSGDAPDKERVRRGGYFGAKAHIGVDSKEVVVHSLATTAASVADKHMLPELLHGDEKKVWGDGGYQGQTEAIRAAAPKAQDMTCRRIRFKNCVDEEAKRKNTTKARVRAKVEWPFRILKRVFGFTKVRYRGLKKKIGRAHV